jgi:hypothetical protein
MDMQLSPKGQQHDDHCACKEIHEWKTWPETLDIGIENGEIKPSPEAIVGALVPLYVISKSDSIEHLYWAPKGWGSLKGASKYTASTVAATPEPKEGFWMDYGRAEELET